MSDYPVWVHTAGRILHDKGVTKEEARASVGRRVHKMRGRTPQAADRPGASNHPNKSPSEAGMIPDEAITAGLAAWGQYPIGVSPKRQMANILAAAAPYLMAQAWDEGRADGGWQTVPTDDGAYTLHRSRNPYRRPE